VLAAILQNLLQEVPAQAVGPLPMVEIDRGGGGPLWPRYDVVDFAAAVATFPEIPGEDPIARAVRRTRWIGEALPLVREARERREAAVFLTGTEFGYQAGWEEGRRSALALDPALGAFAPCEQPTAPEPARPAADRGESGGGTGLVVAALAIGAVGALALLRRRGRASRRRH
jgi:hypothetical protein